MAGASPPGSERTVTTPASTREAVAVINAYGAFRVLLAVLALWSFFEGFALFTGGLPGLSFGGGAARDAERVVGAQMLVFVPVYALLIWRREQYRLLVWVPYGAQLAIILPTAWAVVHGNFDSTLLLVVSLVFFTLLFYYWWHSHPLDFYRQEDDFDDDVELDDDDGDDGGQPASNAPGGTPVASGMSAREPQRRSGRFRRRDR
jgi:hypothetical protein